MRPARSADTRAGCPPAQPRASPALRQSSAACPRTTSTSSARRRSSRRAANSSARSDSASARCASSTTTTEGSSRLMCSSSSSPTATCWPLRKRLGRAARGPQQLVGERRTGRRTRTRRRRPAARVPAVEAEEALDQRRLADPGLALDDQHARVARLAAAANALQLREFGLAIDEGVGEDHGDDVSLRCSVATRDPRRRRAGAAPRSGRASSASTSETLSSGAIACRAWVASFEASSSSTASRACSNIARLTAASRPSASVRTPVGATTRHAEEHAVDEVLADHPHRGRPDEGAGEPAVRPADHVELDLRILARRRAPASPARCW